MKMFCIWIIKRCYFAFLSIDIFVLFTRYSLRYLSQKLYINFIHRILVIVQSLMHSLSLRNNMFVLTRRIAAIALLAIRN